MTKIIYILLWWPSWYLLSFMHRTEGELQWVVTEKVSSYGQSLTLFCSVDNCCNKTAGWRYESVTIFIDMNKYPDNPNLKYGRIYNESGFGLIIRNLSETDVNKTYECIYEFQRSTHQYLLQEDVFKKDDPSTDEETSTTDNILTSDDPSTDEETSTTDNILTSDYPSTDEETSTTDEGDNTTTIVVAVIIGLVLLISIGIVIFYVCRKQQCTNRSDTNDSVQYNAERNGLLSSTSAPGDQHDNIPNTNPITVRVMKKTLSEFGKKMIIKRIEMLLCDSNNCIEAFAIGPTSTKVDNILEKDRVYQISKYKIKNFTDSFMRIEFTKLTQFIVSDEIISYNNLVAKINISEVRDRCRDKEHISLHPVIITSTGQTRQPLNKFLQEIILKDDSGKVIMAIWSEENDIDFQLSRGDVVDLYNVRVEKLNGSSPKPQFSVVYIVNSEIFSSPLKVRKGMERLLENEDPQEMKPIVMTVKELSNLKVEKRLVIVTAGIENFAKDERQMFIVKNCDNVVNHGYLKQEEKKWYCKECGEYRDGKQMLELKATIADDSNVPVRIILFNEASKVVLGKENYDEFLTCDKYKRIQILRKVQSQHIDYTFEINHAEFNLVKKAVKKPPTGVNSTSETQLNN